MGKFLIGVIATIAVLAAIGSNVDKKGGQQVANASSGTTQSESCEASLSEFNSLRTGMSIQQAERVIGCAGVEISRNELPMPEFSNGQYRESTVTTVMYQWDGNSALSNMNAMFQNNRLMSKAQLGLR